MGKLHIDKLGALQNIDFEVKQFNLFIGEQGVGKSTICKAIYFFRLLKGSIIDCFYDNVIFGSDENEKFPNVINKKIRELFISLFGYTWDMPRDMKFSYIYSDEIDITIKINSQYQNKQFLDIEYSDRLLQGIKNCNAKIKTNKEQSDNKPYSFSIYSALYKRIAKDVYSVFNDDDLPTYYIPAGRSLITLLTHQRTTIDYNNLDFINKEFVRLLDEYSAYFDKGVKEIERNHFPRKDRKFSPIDFANDIVKYMKGEYVADDKLGEILKIDDHTRLSINYISSGQQESLWIFNLLYIWLLQDEKAFVIIEEPEAHVYPTMQKFILDFIVQFMNLTDSNIIITTHSPYMLTNSNLLYYAGTLKNRDKNRDKNIDENIDEITGKYKFINPEQSNIYKIKLDENTKDTKFEDLKIKDESDLKTELIDEVSDIINEQYTKLIDLETNEVNL